ncbi:MAG TPA: translation initiation factor [Myxococcota bacterium]|jgi:translation initiation factor 1|nr:translation initiation factor [Myxococcota bacterium]
MARNDRPANPFAALESLRAVLPAARPTAGRALSESRHADGVASGLGERLSSSEPAPAPAAPAVPSEPGPARAVVRMERKGRAGKEVTVVEQLGLDASALQLWLADLKRALGCGGTVHGETLLLQGDQRARLEALLRARGVRRVSVAG